MSAAVSCQLSIKAVPNARRTEAAGWVGDTLKVKIHSPPVDGKANAALCDFLAEQLGLAARAVRLVAGESSRLKRVAVTGLTFPEVRAKLSG